MTAKSASTARPDSVTARATRPSPSKPASGSPHTSSTPRERSCSPTQAATVGPKCVVSGASSSITIVHAVPIIVSEAATSQAMYEPPTRTARPDSSRTAAALPSARR